MVSELSIVVFSFYYNYTYPPPDCQCAGGTHPTGMHPCYEFFLMGTSHCDVIVCV